MTPADTPEKNAVPASPSPEDMAAATPVPWYRRPLFWSALLLLLLALYAGWAVWLQWQAHETRQAELARTLEQQRGANAALEAEAARLRDALKGDPCAAKDALRIPGSPGNSGASGTGMTPRPSDVVPQSVPGQPLQIPSDADAPEVAPAPGPASEIKNVADLLEQATVLILSQTAKGVQMGTGFFVAPGVIVTNQHVAGSADARIIVVNKATKGILQAKVIAISQEKGRDFAVLQVSPAPAVTPLALTPEVRRTERVSAWGFPGAVTGDDPKFQALLSGNARSVPEVVYTDGVVSVILERTPPLIVHTATVSQGNSGGPLVDGKGQVVGINTYIRLDDESYRQSSLAIVASDLMAFLKERGIPFTTAKAKE